MHLCKPYINLCLLFWQKPCFNISLETTQKKRPQNLIKQNKRTSKNATKSHIPFCLLEVTSMIIAYALPAVYLSVALSCVTSDIRKTTYVSLHGLLWQVTFLHSLECRDTSSFCCTHRVKTFHQLFFFNKSVSVEPSIKILKKVDTLHLDI